MFDIYLLFVPILVLPIVLLFVFVGCSFRPGGGGFPIVVKFHPARENMERYKPVVDIRQNGINFPTDLIEGPTELPDGDSQFTFYNSDFFDSDHIGLCTITCSIFLDEIFGNPIIYTSCPFYFSESRRTAFFIIDNLDRVRGCQPEG